MVERCAGDDALKKGETAPKTSTQRGDLFESAAGHYRRAASAVRDPQAKARALDALATALDADHLNRLSDEEATLRELIADAKVVRSIPLLDDEAIRAVRQWRFAPTIVNGEA